MVTPESLLSLIAFVTPYAFVDALIILPATLATIAPLLAAPRPILVASAYTLGLFAGGVASGIVAAFALEEITCWIVRHIDTINNPGPLYCIVQAAIGLLLIRAGTKLFRPSPPQSEETEGKDESRGIALILGGAFILAAIGMFLRLPAALPYLAMINQLLFMPTSWTTNFTGLVYHNLLLASPYAFLISLYLVAPTHGERVLSGVQQWMRTSGRKVLAVLLVVLGLVLAADSVGRQLGYPVLPDFKIDNQDDASTCSADFEARPAAVVNLSRSHSRLWLPN